MWKVAWFSIISSVDNPLHFSERGCVKPPGSLSQDASESFMQPFWDKYALQREHWILLIATQDGFIHGRKFEEIIRFAGGIAATQVIILLLFRLWETSCPQDGATREPGTTRTSQTHLLLPGGKLLPFLLFGHLWKNLADTSVDLYPMVWSQARQISA